MGFLAEIIGNFSHTFVRFLFPPYREVVVYSEDGYKPLFSESDVGQSKFGGWDKEGLDTFKEYKKTSKKVRKTPESKAKEKLILANLRAKMDITENTPEEQARKKNKRKRKEPEIVGESPMDVDLSFSSDEEELIILSDAEEDIVADSAQNTGDTSDDDGEPAGGE